MRSSEGEVDVERVLSVERGDWSVVILLRTMYNGSERRRWIGWVDVEEEHTSAIRGRGIRSGCVQGLAATQWRRSHGEVGDVGRCSAGHSEEEEEGACGVIVGTPGNVSAPVG